MKKLSTLLFFVSANIFGNENNDQELIFDQFKKNITSEYHMNCVATDNIKIIQIINIDENLKAVLLESDEFFCSYIIYLDNHVDLFKNNLIYKCRYNLAKKYFPFLNFSSYIDNIDNS